MHVESPFAAVLPPGACEAHHHGREIRLAEPFGDLALQNARSLVPLQIKMLIGQLIAPALAGDDLDVAKSARVRRQEKGSQGPMRPGLPHAVEIDPILDLERATAELARTLDFEGRRLGGLGR